MGWSSCSPFSLPYLVILLGTETMPFHLAIKEPVTNVHTPFQPGNIAFPKMVESVDPEYLLSTIYTAEDAPLPEFEFVNTTSSSDSISDSVVISGTTVVIRFSSGAVVTVNGDAVGSAAITPNGEVRIVGGIVTVLSADNDGGYVDGGPSLVADDNTARLTIDGSITVINDGWSTFVDGSTTIDDSDTRTDVDGAEDVAISGGTTIIVGLTDGADTCQGTAIVGRTVDETAPADPLWSDFVGRASEVRVSGLLSFTVPGERSVDVQAQLHVDTGDNGDWDGDGSDDNAIAREDDGGLDSTTDTTVLRLASIPLPTVEQ